MSFQLPTNARHAEKIPTTPAGLLGAEVVKSLAVVLVGLVSALLVEILHGGIALLQNIKLNLVRQSLSKNEDYIAFFIHFAFGVVLSSIGFSLVQLSPHVKGSGLPQLICYLNGCKIRGFTSSRVMVGKLLGTICVLAAGFFAGPEGPIIHIGACVGKQLLRALYYSARLRPRQIFSHFASLRNDLDARDFIAIGAGAGIAAAFNAPISGTLFVVEEASSHLSVSLLWRAFSASIIAIWASHLFSGVGEMMVSAFTQNGHLHREHYFHIVFEAGVGVDCSPQDSNVFFVLLLAVLGGWLGAAFNNTVLKVNHLRKVISRNFTNKPILALEVLVLTFLTSASVLLPRIDACRPLTVGWLSTGSSYFESGSGSCVAPGQQCGGSDWRGLRDCCSDARGLFECSAHNASISVCAAAAPKPVPSSCMTEDMINMIDWGSDNASDIGICDAKCLASNLTLSALIEDRCHKGSYEALGSLISQPGEDTVRALFMHGTPFSLPPAILLVGLAVWFIMAALTAGTSLPVGLMVPLIIIGGCFGRLFGVVLAAVQTAQGIDEHAHAEPGLFALFGATAVLAGSGQIRLFLTVVMLEVTDQLVLTPYVAITAIAAVYSSSMLSPHGLYHALIHFNELPYLPPEREHEVEGETSCLSSVIDCKNVDRFTHSLEPQDAEPERLVSEVMGSPLVTVAEGTCLAEAEQQLRHSSHQGFPVLTHNGGLVGLLLRREMQGATSEQLVDVLMDRTPCCVHSGWPLSRAHSLFVTLGLQHLLVLDPAHQRVVGIVTRHDLARHIPLPSASAGIAPVHCSDAAGIGTVSPLVARRADASAPPAHAPTHAPPHALPHAPSLPMEDIETERL